jgi:hypothetical protein
MTNNGEPNSFTKLVAVQPAIDKTPLKSFWVRSTGELSNFKLAENSEVG